MTDPNNIFDDIIRNKLGDYELPGSEDDWHQLELDLDKKSFWKWGFKHFNVYYGSIALLLLIIPFILLLFTSNEGNSIENKADRSFLPGKINNDSSSNSEPLIENSKLSKANKRKLIKDSITTNNLSYQTDSSASKNERGLPDTSNISNKNIIADTTTAKPKKQKRKIVIAKRDTVFVADTLRKVRRK